MNTTALKGTILYSTLFITYIMWKKDLSSVAILSLVASVHETAAFSNNNIINIHTPTLPSCSRSKVSKSVLSESFYNYGKDGPSSSENNGEQESPVAPKKKGFFGNFFEELDAFVDDATSRRLGAGAQYYGKRKSSFYGANDANKKRDRVSFLLIVERMHKLLQFVPLYEMSHHSIILSNIVYIVLCDPFLYFRILLMQLVSAFVESHLLP